MNFFDKALGSHAQALSLQSRRSSVLASNIVNADTPNYKARDIDFKQVLKSSQGDMLKLTGSKSGHIGSSGSGIKGSDLKYRIPLQPSLDGNTVDLDQEKAAFTENAMRYQTTLQFLTGRFTGIKGALKGE